MKNILKRGLSLVLALIMVTGLLPVTAFAAVDSSTGYPKDLKNKLILSIYTTDGKFPGEPATHGSSEYISFNSSFARTSSGGQFKSSAETELSTSILDDNVLVEGTGNSDTKVWGVFSTEGLDQYFLKDASIIQHENELKIIQNIKNCSAEEAEQYEIIWYVIKMQHTPGRWWSSGTSEWHIDGLIKEKQKISINYYGNGNTTGSAPDGVSNHTAGDVYTVQDKNNMQKKVNGKDVEFLGWSAKADGSGDEIAFYQPGQVINPTQNLSLYAMWDTTTQHTATVKTYLDDVLAAEDDIHSVDSRELYLSTDKEHYDRLYETSEKGVYTASITGNGKFQLYYKEDDEYFPVGNRQLTIYNQDATMEVYHYSLTYDTNDGEFEQDLPAEIYYYGNTVTATSEIPTREGYRFVGWEYDGKTIQPGEEVTASVTTGPMVLTAQWEKTINVTVNVTIDHNGGDGYDQTEGKDDVFLSLVSRVDADSPYLEVEGKDLNLDKGVVPKEQKVTEYLGNTFVDLPGGTTEYTVATSKSGYETTVEHHKDDDGNWIIDVKMVYKPSNFDLDFSVVVDENVPDEYVPKAAIVKVTFWSSDREEWAIITQQENGNPGVRVDIDPNTRTGTGSYPVWKYEDDTPYGNRIQVTAFVYPDGTIVPASGVVTQDVAWTDNVYTATVRDVVGGEIYGTLKGAYYSDTTEKQEGILIADITMDLHNVTFDAQGGKVNGADSQTVEKQYKVPSFKDYVPTRDGGYIFDGWYLDKDYTEAAAEGVDLTEDITLYAKWIAPITIEGTITVAGTYQQDGETVQVHDIDRALQVYVVLKEVRKDHNNGVHYYEVDSELIDVEYVDNNGTAHYSFANIPNDGKEYHIEVLMLNYDTGYDNEDDADEVFNADEYKAVLNGDNVAQVDAHLTFVPPSYDQKMVVDATQIGNGFRPTDVLAQIIYRDVGDIHPYHVISQHDVEPYGVVIDLDEDGNGNGSESIWKWHTDGTLYEYQMQVAEVDGEAFDSATAPYYISYTDPTYWDANTNNVSGVMKATLIPKKYPVTFDLNGGTGMDDFKVNAETAGIDATHAYAEGHTWSVETKIEDADPERAGYTFKGWESDVEGVTTDNEGNVIIPADVHENVNLTAIWELNTYEVTTDVVTLASDGTTISTEVGGSATVSPERDNNRYDHGSEVTVTATANDGYTFQGWYEDGKMVSNETSYTISALNADHALVAKFSLNKHTVVTNAELEAGGITTGAGSYDYGTEVTVTATANIGYTFQGWQEDGKLVSSDAEYSFTITKNRDLTAVFTLDQHEVTTVASPEVGGTTTGDGTYAYGTEVTVNATANTGYTFTGWYENGNLVSEAAGYKFTVEGDRSLIAEFVEINYEVKVQADNGGQAEGTATYHYGDTAIVTATVDKTFTFDGWYEGETKVSDDLVYTFTVISDRNLTAKFIKNGYNIEIKVTEGGSAQGAGYYDEGETATLTANAQEGYKFMGWYENGDLVLSDAEYSFSVTSNRELTAKFAIAYTITTIAEPAEGGTVTGGGVYEQNATVKITAKANDGYYFEGWYLKDGESMTHITPNEEYTLPELGNYTYVAKFQKEITYEWDYVYLFGYSDTQIGAEGPLLRGELAQMIYRLVRQNNKVGKATGTPFADTEGQWYQSGMTYMGMVGAIDKSKTNGYPNMQVKRGEAYKMICLGLGYTDNTNLSSGEYATLLRNANILSDDDKVTGTLKRYEFCEIFNEILGRSDFELIDINGKPVTVDIYHYTDLDPNAPYYKTMMIATSTFRNGRIDTANRMDRNTYDYTN